ncbi:Alpha/beta hydrolase family protein [Pseudomonas sp. 37 R 15]|uniref:alpha/beta fold hydrolase n=1 Tax=Pseudomonas sp. 37 R 15 TaxID=1844104 RepID=UPI00081227BF|nr:alpha/beta hydrolase [Pseudomonas sp. 37 R 15]CRM38115.1 Alpha/beta hydrolase family protein [Pseudomonas sp. 37 R 15]
MSRACFVLVHGAFHGGWCWRPVASGLRRLGYDVHTPTQTGLGDRSHLMSAAITMDTFVRDIELTIEMEELTDVILVGHSFGSRSICGVADKIPEKLNHLVFIDGGLPLDGRSRLDAMAPQARADRLARAAKNDGVSVSPPAPSAFGVSDPALAQWLKRRLTPQPFGVDTTRLNLANPIGNGVPATYLRCTRPAFPGVDASAAFARDRQDWNYLEVEAPHNVIVTHPEWIIDTLHGIAGKAFNI